jgi:hypothetical protein
MPQISAHGICDGVVGGHIDAAHGGPEGPARLCNDSRVPWWGLQDCPYRRTRSWIGARSHRSCASADHDRCCAHRRCPRCLQPGRGPGGLRVFGNIRDSTDVPRGSSTSGTIALCNRVNGARVRSLRCTGQSRLSREVRNMSWTRLKLPSGTPPNVQILYYVGRLSYYPRVYCTVLYCRSVFGRRDDPEFIHGFCYSTAVHVRRLRVRAVEVRESVSRVTCRAVECCGCLATMQR